MRCSGCDPHFFQSVPTMNIPTFDFSGNPSQDFLRIFSDEIETDDWVLFHGTSGYNTNRIEGEGFTSRR